MTIDWLLDRMLDYGDRSAMISDNETVTYRDILICYDQWCKRLKEFDIQPGEVIALEGDYSAAICCAILACIANGNVIVPLTSAISHRRKEIMEIGCVNKTIIFDHSSFSMQEINASPRFTGILEECTARKQPGMILFTSGSTGVPKAILHDITKLIERYKFPREKLCTLSFLLFDHIGGFNTLFHTLSNGGTIVVPVDRSAETICSLIEKFSVELLPTSPSFLNLLLLSEAYVRYKLSSLKVITYGTEVMPDFTLNQLASVFPQVQLRQTYGLSELGILRVKSKASGSAWMSIGGEGVETKIVDNLLFIRSKSAMLGYLNAPNPFDEEGWLNTQDEVVQEDGFIRILGRRSEIINVGGNKVYPVEVESVLLSMPEIIDVIIKGEPNAILGQIVTAVVSTSTHISAPDLKERVRSFCYNRLENFQIPMKIYIQNEQLFSGRYKKMRN